MAAGLQRDRERGFISVEFIYLVALSLFFFMYMVNILLWQFAKGVVREATAEGVRVAASVGNTAGPCEQRANQILNGLGQIATERSTHCRMDTAPNGDHRVIATAHVKVNSWIPMVHDF